MNDSFQIVLIAAAVISGICHIISDRYKKYTAIYFFKPLTVLIILILAINRTAVDSIYYKIFILLGLSYSLLGDLFLMLRQVKFIPGLISFLIAHLFYIIAFAQKIFYAFNPLSLAAIVLSVTIFLFLFAQAGEKYKTAVRLYFLVLTMMLWMAFNRWMVENTPGVSFALTGTILFVFSDAVLAYNRFVKPLNRSQIMILSSYYPAQILIALSI